MNYDYCESRFDNPAVIVTEVATGFTATEYSHFVCSLRRGHGGEHRACVGHEDLNPRAFRVAWITELIIEEVPI